MLTEIIQKIEANKLYGINKLNIHAIGQDNVDKLKHILDDKSVQKFYTDEPSIAIDGSIMLAQIFF